MKQILITIIMIVSSCVSGQIDTLLYNKIESLNLWNIDNTVIYDKVQAEQVLTDPIPFTLVGQNDTWVEINPNIYCSELIEQYQAYKLECYNDSTIRYINPIPEGHNHVHYVNWYTEAQCNDNHTRTYWKHKKPTFDGFMNYLIKNQ